MLKISPTELIFDREDQNFNTPFFFALPYVDFDKNIDFGIAPHQIPGFDILSFPQAESGLKLTFNEGVHDYPGGWQTNAVLALDGDPLSGRISDGDDVDWLLIDDLYSTRSNSVVVNIASETADGLIVRLLAVDRSGRGDIIFSTDIMPNASGEYLVDFPEPATSTTWHYLEVVSLDGNAHDYTLSVRTSDGGELDYAADATTHGIIDINADIKYVAGHLTSENDVDWFSFIRPESSDMLRFTFDTSRDAEISVRLVGLESLDTQDISYSLDLSASENRLYASDFPEDLFYFLEITQLSTTPMPYSIGVTEHSAFLNPADDFHNNEYTTGRAIVGETTHATFHNRIDSDWFVLRVEEDVGYSIVYSFEADDLKYITVSDHFLNVMTDPDAGTTTINFVGAYSGIVYVQASTFDSALDYSYDYSFTVDTFDAVPDIPDNITTTAEIVSGEIINGEYGSRYDIDWYRLSLDAGETITLFGEMDTTRIIRLYDADANEVGIFRRSHPSDVFTAFQAESAGDYFLSFESFALNTEEYTFSPYIIQVDDEDSLETAPYLGSDQLEFGLPDDENDTDYFRVTAVGDFIYLAMEFVHRAGQFTDIEVLDLDGNVLVLTSRIMGSGDHGGNMIYSAFEAIAGQDYIIKINFSNLDFTDGFYTILHTALEHDDYSDDINTSGRLYLNMPLTGTLDFPGESDWFVIDADAGERFTLRLEAPEGTNSVVFYDAQGNLFNVAPDVLNTDQGGIYYLEALESGEFFVAINGRGGIGSNYTLTLETSPDLHNASIYTSSVVTSGHSLRGVRQTSNDEDWFRIEMNAGEMWFFENQTRSRTDYDFTIYDASGQEVLDENAGTDLNILGFSVLAEETGTYYVAIEGGGFNTPYHFQALNLEDDFSSDVRTTGRLIAEQTTSGVLQVSGDTDWFAINVQAGTSYLFTEQTSIDFPYRIMNVYTSVGQDVSGTDLVTGLSGTAFTFNESGTYFIEVGVGSRGREYHLPNFEYNITPILLIDEAGDTAVTATRLNSGDMISGYITGQEDQDWFAITANQGDFLNFELSHNIDVRVRILDQNGDYVIDVGAEPLEVLISGTYYVSIYTTGSGLRAYELEFDNAREVNFNLGSDDNVYVGTSFDEYINGEAGSDRIDGGRGDDIIEGGLGQDYLDGSSGADELYGGDGNDILVGGEGGDTLSGGAGADIFVFGDNHGNDLILDFDVTSDRIEINFSPYFTLEEILDLVRYLGDDIMIQTSATNTIVFNGLVSTDLTLDNFIFTGIPEDGVGPFRDPTDIPKEGTTTSSNSKEKLPLIMEVYDVADDVSMTEVLSDMPDAQVFHAMNHNPIEDLPTDYGVTSTFDMLGFG